MTAAVELRVPPAESLEVGFYGFVHDVSLVDLLQIFHYARRTLVLYIDEDASIHFVNGEVIHAQWGTLSGDQAFAGLLRLSGGRIRTAAGIQVQPTLERPFNYLLLDALREMDEAVPKEEGEFVSEGSGAFANGGSIHPRASRFPSTPAAGEDLLQTVCECIAAQVERARGVSIYQLHERRSVAHAGAVERGRLEAEIRTVFEHAVLNAQNPSPSDQAASSEWSEARATGDEGAYFAMVAPERKVAVVLSVFGDDSPDLAWAQLRQWTTLLERLP